MEVICANNLYVENIPSSWYEVDLERLFTPFGHIQRVLILRNRKGESKGKGFVNFVLESEARSVLEHIKELNPESSLSEDDEKLMGLKLSLARLQAKPPPRSRARSSTSGSIERKYGYGANTTFNNSSVPVVDQNRTSVGRGRAQTVPRLGSTTARGWNLGAQNVAETSQGYPIYVHPSNQPQRQWVLQANGQMVQNGYVTYVNQQPTGLLGYGFVSTPQFMYGQLGYGA